MKLYADLKEATAEYATLLDKPKEDLRNLQKRVDALREQSEECSKSYLEVRSSLTSYELREERINHELDILKENSLRIDRELDTNVEDLRDNGARPKVKLQSLLRLEESIEKLSVDKTAMNDGVLDALLTCVEAGGKIPAFESTASKFTGTISEISSWMELIDSAMDTNREIESHLGDTFPDLDLDVECEDQIRREIEFLEILEEFLSLPASTEELEQAVTCVNNSSFKITADSLVEFKFPSDEIERLSNCLSASITPKQMFHSVLPKFKEALLDNVELNREIVSLNALIHVREMDMSLVEEELSSTREVTDEISATRSDITETRQILADYAILTEAYQASVKLKQLEKDRTALDTELRMQSTLKLMLKTANHEAIKELVDTINHEWHRMLSPMLGNGLSVRLSLERELKNKRKGGFKGDTRTEVLVNVLKEEVEVGQVGSLSGGELEKMHITFFLCINKLMNNRLIVVDETLSTLDSDSMDGVVDNLKENHSGLIVIVNHRHGDGRYDHCLDLEAQVSDR